MVDSQVMQLSSATVALAHWFGLERGSAGVLGALLAMDGAPLTAAELAVKALTTAGAVKARICEIRRAMKCEAVDTVRGAGYRLSEIGLAECRSALYQLAAEIAESAAPATEAVRLVA